MDVSGPMLKIDIHTHILPPDIPEFKKMFGYGGSDTDNTLEDLVAFKVEGNLYRFEKDMKTPL